MKRFKIDFSFFILLAIISLSPKQDIVLKLLLCLFLHELGHLVFIWIFHYKVAALRLSLFGFFMRLDRNQTECIKDIFVYLGGILMNLACYLFIPDPTIKKVSLLLILFNSLPIYPLDGFQVIQSILSYFIPYRIVLKFMSSISLICSSILFLYLTTNRMDLFVLFNAGYLIFLSALYFFKEEKVVFQKFLLEKSLYPSTYPIRKIKLQERFNLCFYKYHTTQMVVGDKTIEEREILNTRKLFQ